VRISFEALAVKNVVGNLKVVDWQYQSKHWEHLRAVKFPSFQHGRKVDVLIGADYPALHEVIKEIKGDAGEPMATLTPLGWTCIGPVAKISISNDCRYFVRSYFTNRNYLDAQLEKFWAMDELPEASQPTMSPDEQKVFNDANANIRYIGGRYEIPTPWREERDNIPSTQRLAESRLLSLMKKLSKDEDLKVKYSKIIANHQAKGYISEVEKNGSESSEWLLPHFPVVRDDKETTKVRIVFDAAAKVSGRCLNDYIHIGPKLQANIFAVLLRFRKHQVAVICDVKEMYLQIAIPEIDRPFHRFLWQVDGELKKFQFNRVVFGVNASPFMAQFVSKYNAQQFAKDLVRAKETILKSTYMDDCIDSVSTVEEAIELVRGLTEIWKHAGMEVHKWLTNKPAVIEVIPVEKRAKEFRLEEESEIAVKTLGLKWLASSDCFTFDALSKLPTKITKRTFLSTLSRIFDPLGFLAAFVIRAKAITQNMWLAGVGWDDILAPEINKEAQDWISEIPYLKDVKIDRCLMKSVSKEM